MTSLTPKQGKTEEEQELDRNVSPLNQFGQCCGWPSHAKLCHSVLILLLLPVLNSCTFIWATSLIPSIHCGHRNFTYFCIFMFILMARYKTHKYSWSLYSGFYLILHTAVCMSILMARYKSHKYSWSLFLR